MLEEAFEVATEFRFDVGHAVLGTQQLQGAVDSLDKSVQGAMTNLNFLATGLVAHLGLGSGGLLGILTKAFKVSEEFTGDTLNFANNISSNFQFLSGHIETFNDRLESSRNILGDIRKEALIAGLDSHQLGSVVQRISAPMAKHEKLGTNYAGGIQMARNMMLASSAVGIHPQQMTETIARAMTDNMSIHGAVFQRLVGTQAFRDSKISNQGQLLHMDGGKKIDLLTKALAQLGGNAEFIAYRMNLISVQFQIFKTHLEELLKPIGDAIIVPLKKMFIAANAWLSKNGPAMGQAIGKVITDIIGDPEALLVNLGQLKNFKKDLHRAMDWTGFGILASTVLGFFTKTKGIGKALHNFLGLGQGEGFLTILSSEAGVVSKLFRLIGSAIADFIPNVAALLFFFQIISRAQTKAKIADAKDWLEMTPRFLEVFVKLKTAIANIFLPLTMAIDGFSDLLAPLFQTSILGHVFLFLLEQLVPIFQMLGDVVIAILGMLSGAMSSIMGVFYDLGSGKFKDIMKDIIPNFKEGFQDFTTKHPFSGAGTPSPQTVVYNNNKIEARFDMREQLEPDRVAFAVTEHLKKLTINAIQGSNDSFNRAWGHMEEAGAR